jgi:hypothetical protein
MTELSIYVVEFSEVVELSTCGVDSSVSRNFQYMLCNSL